MNGTESLIGKDTLIIIITNLFTLASIWLRDYLKTKQLHKTILSPIDRSELFIRLTQICGQIRNDLKANGVYIAYFHNGDHFKNGMSIDKFTVVAEDYDNKLKGSYICKYQMITINYINYLYHRLLTDGRCYKENISELDMIDNNYKEDLLKRGIYSSYSFLIKDDNEKPIGFISLEYNNSFEFKREHESYIWKHQLSTSKSIKNIIKK